MSLRRKKQKKIHGKRKTLPLIKENRTRSTTAWKVASETALNEPPLSRQSSDSSIVYLGSYRRVPELINLEDSCDNHERKTGTKSPKFEEVNVMQKGQQLKID